MKRLASLMKSIDDFIFKQVDQIRSTAPYRQALNSISSLDSMWQKIVNHLLSILTVFIPILLILIFFIINLNLKSRVETKEAIQENINKLNITKNRSSSFTKQIVSSDQMATQQEFSSKLISLISNKKVEARNITVKDFKEVKNMESFKKYSSTIIFSKLSIDDFAEVTNSLINKMKVVVTSAEIEKNIINRTLKGTLKIIHFNSVK